MSQHVDDPTQWVLCETYDAPDSPAAHRQSPHFLAYDAFARDAVIDKTGGPLRDQARNVSPLTTH